MADYSNIAVAILMGGLGIRLRDVISDRPKVLAEIHGRPFLANLFDQLTFAEVREVVLCTGYMGQMIQNKIGKAYKSLRITYSKEERPMGTGGALRLALPHLKTDTILVMNGDSYIETDLKNFMDWFQKKNLSAALILTSVSDTRRYATVELDEDDRIINFEEKSRNAREGWISAGIYLLKKKLIKTIPSGQIYSLEKDFFPGLIKTGLYGFPCRSQFIDIGTPESYSRASIFFQKLCNRGSTKSHKKRATS